MNSNAYNTTDSPARWGDFGSVVADPVDGSFWITHEYVHSTTAQDWGTWWHNLFIP